MPWVKLDDSFTDHEKVEALSDRAFRLHVAGLCFCARMLTDGVIVTDRVRRLLPKVTKGMVDELLAAGVWLTHPEGFEVHGYLDYNPSKEKVLETRAATAARKAAFLARKAEKEAAKNAVRNASGNASGGTLPQPNPTQPVGHWVGVQGSQANESPPSPSAGDDEEGQAPPLEVVRSIVEATRAKSLKPKVVPGPDGSKECPCDNPWEACNPACPKLENATAVAR